MGLFSFIKSAGEKLFGKDEKEVAAKAADNLEDLNRNAAAAIEAHIAKQNLNLTDLQVQFDGSSGKVVLSGQAPSREAAEKAILAAGNVTGVSDVENHLQLPAETAAQEAEVRYHDVVSGDTLSAIAKKYYGNANLYMKIFEANKPMLSHPDKIYVDQKLRIPT